MNNAYLSIFERHAKLTIFIVLLSFFLIFIVSVELLLQYSTGLGHPPLFYKNPHYGFRLRPNQNTVRFYGAKFNINNLGLRSQKDWDSITENKILFLGDSVTYGGNHLSNDELFSEIAVQNLLGYLNRHTKDFINRN